MGGFSKNGLVLTGAVLALLGVLAIAVPVFTTEQNTDVAKIGDLKLTAKEETSHVIPPVVGPAALVLGLVLVGAGFVVKR